MEKSMKLLKITVDLKPVKKALAQIEEQMKTISGTLEQRLPEEARDIARNTKGVSEKQMAILLSLIGGKHFEKRSQLIAYVGLDIAALGAASRNCPNEAMGMPERSFTRPPGA